MNENWAHAIAGFIATCFIGIVARLHSRQDRFESDYVKRQEFTDAMNAMREERREMHAENQSVLGRIHERVDDLWERP